MIASLLACPQALSIAGTSQEPIRRLNVSESSSDKNQLWWTRAAFKKQPAIDDNTIRLSTRLRRTKQQKKHPRGRSYKDAKIKLTQ